MTVRREFIKRIGQLVHVVTVAGYEIGPVRIVDAVEADDVASIQLADGTAGVLVLAQVFLVKDVIEHPIDADYQQKLPLG